jgi:hypothetical protein
MKSTYMLVLAFFAVLTLACSTPQDRAYKAQENVHKERLKLVDEYKKCVETAGTDKQKVEACDQYLKAANALK